MSDYFRKEDRFYYLRTGNDVEIDLIIERSKRETWAIEIKSAERVDDTELKRSLELAKDLKIKRFVVASREKQKRTCDGFEVWPWQELLAELYL